MNNGFNSGGFKTAMFADCLANSKEIFQLIDQVFPLDSCRHYQVLPLKLDGNYLVLGMLDPQNEESKNFANSIAKVFKYDLEVQLIDLQTHQIILANYPQNTVQSSRQQQDDHKTVIDTSFNPNAPLKGVNHRRAIDSAPTIISHAAASRIDEPDLELELSDLPADLDFLKDLDLTAKPKQQAKAKVDATATLFEIPPEFSHQNPANNLDHKATIIADPAELLTPESNHELKNALEEAQISQLIAETLGQKSPIVEPKTVDFLPQLSSQLSWQKLLEQAFQYHSEYITLTRYSDRGGIVTQKDNSVQSSLDRVPLPIFCSLIDEIKRMAKLPQNTSTHPQKLVLERFSEQERILLRLEFSIQQQLDTVAIQILRGVALKTYEQQQMDRVSAQALELAKQLEKTLRKIQACFDSAELTNLQELQTIHSRISHQLRLLDK
ncbi:MAG: hypothetical protein HC775_19430 [Hyellaceae cyanobacterium CSU_1_1]|nr:hypothetical protein [Hyellaceae cyanobacterium CSU_1_1]